MRSLLCVIFLLAGFSSSHAAITMAVDQQSPAALKERASQLAKQIGSQLGTGVDVIVLPDNAQLEAWLNRYATAELAVVEASFLASRPGQFVTIGPVGRDFVLIGRQGIGGELPQRLAAMLGAGGERPVMTGEGAKPPAGQIRAATKPATEPEMQYGPSKSVNEDRYFVSYVYRERLNRTPDAEHLEYWTEQLQKGAVTKPQLFESACDLENKKCGDR
jgi:hypothetical protein